MPINRDYYGAAQRGVEDAYGRKALEQRNILGGIDVAKAQEFQKLMGNPQATPEQYARVGRADVANYLTGQNNAAEEQRKQAATRLLQAAQYGLSAESPKQFVQNNYPELVKQYRGDWNTATDEQIKSSLKEAIGVFGPIAGVGPPDSKGIGALYKYKDSTSGKVLYGDASQAGGKEPYIDQGGQSPPSGYQWNGRGLEPIPGGPADPSVITNKNPNRIFQMADKLRDEFNTQSKDFISVGDSYNTVKAAANDPSAAGDLSMIFAYMKMLDPTSVVREQEFANAQNAAGVPDRIRNQWNKVLNGERLNPDQRKDFITQARKVYEIRKQRNQAVVKRYTEIAKRNNVNPDDVVGDMSVYEAGQAQTQQPQQASAPVRVSSPQEAMKLPSGTVFITPDGRQKVRP